MASDSTPQSRSIRAYVSEQSLRLPEEIIEEILSRLPVKSLLKFRCVSKPLRSLIGSKRFIQKHLDNSTKNPKFADHKIILNSDYSQRGLKQCSLLSMLNDPSTVQFTPCDLVTNRWHPIRIVGCCNGLVCLLLDYTRFMLWNPSTRTTNLLPVVDDKIEEGCITNCGFGCDDLSGDYMVFGIVTFHWNGSIGSICKVYSLEANSWKIVKKKTFDPFYTERVFASGKIHWSSTLNKDSNIVSFDLRSDMYDVIELPVKNGDFYKSLGMVGGSLSMLYGYSDHLDIWVMKEYGVKESWEKVVDIPYLHTIPEIPLWSLFFIGSNGEILLTLGSSFVIFYPEGDGFRLCQARDPGSFRQAFIYVESLVQCTPYREL